MVLGSNAAGQHALVGEAPPAAAAVIAGLDHSYVLCTDGAVVASGCNTDGQLGAVTGKRGYAWAAVRQSAVFAPLGNATDTPSFTAHTVSCLPAVVDVACSADTALAIDTVRRWDLCISLVVAFILIPLGGLVWVSLGLGQQRIRPASRGIFQRPCPLTITSANAERCIRCVT